MKHGEQPGARPAGGAADKEEAAGIFSIVGVGPGDPELMTFRAARELEQAQVLIAPRGREEGPSQALEIAAAKVDVRGKRVRLAYFPMRKVRSGEAPEPEVAAAWEACAALALEHVEAGERVAFPVLGDPSLYATSAYVQARLAALSPRVLVRVVPGISAMSACAARVGRPLGLGNETVTIVPAAFDLDNLRPLLRRGGSLVLMKVHRRLPALVGLLEEAGLLEHAVLIERCGLPEERIVSDLRAAAGRELHYFSTILVRPGPLPGE